MRRTPTVLVAATVAAALGLAACGDDDDKDDTKTTTRTTTATGTTARARSANDQGGQQLAGGGGGGALIGAAGAAGVDDNATPSTGLRPFNADSPWNTTVDQQPVDARSATWMRLAAFRIGVEENAQSGEVSRTREAVNKGVFINTAKWTTPVVDETDAVPTRIICRQTKGQTPPLCGNGDEIDTLLIPANESPRPQYDGWFTVLNREEGVAYDLWRARRAPGQNVMSYQYLRKWDLNGPGFLEPDKVSARGSGLPLFAGLILPEEIRSGRIDHALAISLPGPAQRRYVQPASSTDGVGDVNSIPEGARIRLKRSVVLTTSSIGDRTNRRAARAIFDALRRYGAIVVDRSAVPTLYAKLNASWTDPLRDARQRLLDPDGRLLDAPVRALPNQGTPLLRGSELEQLKVSDFEVVQTRGNLLTYPPVQTRGAATAVTAAQTSSPGVP